MATQVSGGKSSSIGTRNWRHPFQWPIKSITMIRFSIFMNNPAILRNWHTTTHQQGRPSPNSHNATLPFPFPFSPFPVLPSPPFPYSFFPCPLPCHSFPSFLPLEVGPLNPARAWGSAVSSPSEVWGGVPAEIEFGAF